MEKTHDKNQYSRVEGRKFLGFVRPPRTTQKSQREPIALKPITFPTKADALAFKERFDA